MFNLKSGDVFSSDKIAQGLNQMRTAYTARQHSNFAALPDAKVNDSKGIIDLLIDCDEGKRVQ